ncbi:MAG TPA: iron-containing redox enzyme family protein [Byssovorax sp.]|jgi:pyrroloquinoline quinone (PQQ) biosynthesis protein C
MQIEKTGSSRAFLAGLRDEIATHPAVNHVFLSRLATTPFSREDYRVFGENHFSLVCVFTSYLERLLVRAPDSEAKLWLAKVLVDEYGEGSRGEDHATLYAHFLRAAGSAMPDLPTFPVPEPARRFVATHRRIVTKESFLYGLGAIGPGHEWAIPKMFDAVIPGLRRAGFTEEEIHYFTLHVDQDEDHGAWLEEALAKLGDTADKQREIRRGALASLEARGEFWSGVQRAVVAWRQPRSARLDGPRLRSPAHELLLTAWDYSPFPRVIARTVGALRERVRPTLDDVLAKARQ